MRLVRFSISILFCSIVFTGLCTLGWASCGELLTGGVPVSANSDVQQFQSNAQQRDGSASAANNSMVGLWHIKFLVGDQVIQEAFQIWNLGGTEVHNPNVDPRQGNVCFGVWREIAPRTFKLTHRIWAYDTNGNFQGVIYLSETVSLADHGNTHHGSFTLELHDLSGNFLAQIATGVVNGERIPPE